MYVPLYSKQSTSRYVRGSLKPPSQVLNMRTVLSREVLNCFLDIDQTAIKVI